MKRIITIILLGCILLYISGFFLAYQFRKAAIKNEVKAYLQANPATGIGGFITFNAKAGKITDQDFSWNEEHEFIYKGEMYDVISVKTTPASVVVHCVKDKDENSLNELYRQIHKNHSTDAANNMNKFFSQVFFISEPGEYYIDSLEQPVYSRLTHADLSTIYFAVTTPPPDVVI